MTAREKVFPKRWFYCFVTGELFQSGEYYACPECGASLTLRERQDGRHEAGAIVQDAA